MEVKNSLKLYILAQGADAAPPLGTVLGNLGVNSINFCKEFNLFTEDLPNFLTLSIKILVFSNKSYKFTVEGLPLTPVLSLFSFERSVWLGGKNLQQRCIALKSLIQLAAFFFPAINIKRTLPVLLGTTKCAGLVVV